MRRKRKDDSWAEKGESENVSGGKQENSVASIRKHLMRIPLSPANQTALKHFDKYYPHIFGAAAWSGIRAALLTPPAKVAILNAVNPAFQECLVELHSRNYLDLFTELTKPVEVSQTSQTAELISSQQPKEKPESVFQNRQFLVREDTVSDQLSEFVPATEFIGERVIYTRDSDKGYLLQSNSDLMTSKAIDLPVVKEDSKWVESFKNLKCMVLPTGTFSDLPRPKYNGNCYDFYPLDLGSVLAVLLLDIQPETRMLDLCSAPGGKAVVSLQTLNLSHFPTACVPFLERLVCTDTSATRLERLRIVLNGFAWGIGSDRPGFPSVEVYSTNSLLRNSKNRGSQRFSRVLVDVPCSTDRDALTSISGGYFARGKSSERIGLPETQKRLLRYAMSLCDVGGYIVYSTCTLSAAQNQGVIESCLSTPNPPDARNEDVSFVVIDPTEFIDHCAAQLHPSLGVRIVPASRWDRGPPLGALVVPRIAANYGPTFMCKIKRVK